MLGLGVFVAQEAHGGEVALDVALSLNRQPPSRHQLKTEEGKSAQIQLEGQVRLFINPIVTKDGAILLSMRVEVPAGARWVEVGRAADHGGERRPGYGEGHVAQGQCLSRSPSGRGGCERFSRRCWHRDRRLPHGRASGKSCG